MKIIPEKYQCEVCGEIYSTREEAERCENRVLHEYPVGMIFADQRPNAFYANMTFAIAKVVIYKHWNDSPLWACRDNGAGDTLGKQKCSGGGFVRLGPNDAITDFDHPTFKRMVVYLKSENIPITIWDGEKPVVREDL